MVGLCAGDVVDRAQELEVRLSREKTDRTGAQVVKLVPATNNPRCCPVALYRRYRALRPQNSDRFFLHFKGGRYVNAPVGKNELSKIAGIISAALGHEGRVTSHSFRTTAATTFIE